MDLEADAIDFKQLQRECEQLRARLRQTEEELVATREVAEELKDRVSAMNQLNTRLQLEKAELEGQLNSVSPYSTVSEDKMERLEQEREELQLECSDLKDQVTALRKALEHAEEMARDANEERESIWEELTSLQKEYDEMAAKLHDLQGSGAQPREASAANRGKHGRRR